MKWPAVILLLMGLVAAGAAAVLVGSLRARPLSVAQAPVAREANILVAALDLRAGAVIDNGSILTRRVAADQAPAGCLTHPSQAVGRVLRAPMAAEQLFTHGCFAQLALPLRPGKVAKTLMLSPEAAIAGHLRPGCVVDVLTSFRVPSPQDGRQSEEMVSVTFLHGILVLAIEDRTIVSEEEKAGQADPSAPGSTSPVQRTRRQLVTLEVDPKEAEELQLAETLGSIALTMVDPLAERTADPGPTGLRDVLARLREKSSSPPEPEEPPSQPATEPEKASEPIMWSIEIVRNGQATEAKVAMPADADRLPVSSQQP